MEKFFCYLRLPVAFVAAIILVIIFSVLGLFIVAFFRSHRPATWVTAAFGRCLFYFIGVRLRVEGSENIPNEGAVYLFNHVSLLDIPTLAAAAPKTDIRFGAKASLFKVPFMGWFMRANGTLAIHRGNREKTLRTYKESIPKMEAGLCYALAPEGTRGDGYELKKFKTGPFIFAISAQVKLVPVVINGLNKVMPKKSFLLGCNKWRQDVIVRFLPPHETTSLTTQDRAELSERVRSEMVVAFAEGQKKLGLPSAYESRSAHLQEAPS